MTAPVVALALVGPTASGKSAVALELARRHRDLELVSVDSMQVYRGMDIGTAKPSPAERGEIVHHLLDVVDPDEDYTAVRFRHDVAAALDQVAGRGHRALLVGGTGLYLRAVVDGLDIPGRFPAARAEIEAETDTAALHERLRLLDPVAASRMDPANRRRIVRALEVTEGSGRPFSSFGPGLESYPPRPFPLVGLDLDRDELDQRIERRLVDQLEVGFLDEVRGLAAGPHPPGRTASQALGYRELLAHVAGEIDLDEAVELTLVRTRRFARRQQRWFRRDPRIVAVAAGHNALGAIDSLLGD